MEIVMTFGLVYTVYATAIDPKRGSLGTIAPIAIGFIVGANILLGGAFTGASMNPAVSFGPALVSWSWAYQWVYWVGPLIGGAIAAIVYDVFFITPTTSRSPRPTTDHRSSPHSPQPSRLLSMHKILDPCMQYSSLISCFFLMNLSRAWFNSVVRSVVVVY
uniref:Aquaporin TIP1-1 n=1 Tax=Ananas comosus var. bracteatus TaxID=296719 RepID=A0A6V7PZ62_ANACO|nr:unnamed protein product [Ananas comosus var. bracteatus]